jgi:hypothetical protein
VLFLAGTVLGLPFAPTLLLGDGERGPARRGRSNGSRTSPLRNAPRVSAIITALGVGLFLENLTLAFYTVPAERAAVARERDVAFRWHLDLLAADRDHQPVAAR